MSSQGRPLPLPPSFWQIMSAPRNCTLASHLSLLLALLVLLGLLASQCWQHDWTLYFSSPLASANLRLGTTPLLQINKNDILPGVSVSRSFTIFPDSAKVVLDVDGENCQERDTYGDNVCHWDWDAKIGAAVHSVLDQPIRQDDFVEGHVKVRKTKNQRTESVCASLAVTHATSLLQIDGFIPYHFRCALCGQDCILSIPVVKANFTIPTSDHCPIPVGQHSKRIVRHLWANSPTDGHITTSLEATIAAIQGSTGKKLVEVKLSAHVK